MTKVDQFDELTKDIVEEIAHEPGGNTCLYWSCRIRPGSPYRMLDDADWARLHRARATVLEALLRLDLVEVYKSLLEPRRALGGRTTEVFKWHRGCLQVYNIREAIAKHEGLPTPS